MRHHRLARLATPRLLLTGALTLASALGVSTVQGPREEAVYGVSSAGGLTRLSADNGAARREAAAETGDGDEAASGAEMDVEGGAQMRAEPAERPKLERAGPKIRTAEKPATTDPPRPEPEAGETPEPPPPPPPPPPPEPVDPVWTSLAACESGGNWHINTGNGYYGGLQFSVESWQGVGGQGYPHEHPREVQIAMAERLHSLQGWNAWPVCSRRLGLI